LLCSRLYFTEYICLPSVVHDQEDAWWLQANASWQLGATQLEVHGAAVGNPARSHDPTHILCLKGLFYLSV
jgi:hypothetical protein